MRRRGLAGNKLLFWWLSLWLVAFGSHWTGAWLIPRQVFAQSANMILFFDGSTVPSGWTIVSQNDINGVFYQKFPRGDTVANAGQTGGSTTHSHSISWFSSSVPSGLPAITGSGSAIASDSHTHDSLSNSSMDSATSLPPYRDLKIIRYNSGIPTTIPQNAIAIFDATPASGSWSRYSAQDTYFVRGEATVGGTGGSSTHTHTNVSITTGGPSASTGASGIRTPISSTSSHTHSGSGTSASANHEPKHVDVLLYQATSSNSLVNGMIAMFDGDPASAAWDLLSDSGDVFNERFLQGASSYNTGQGNATHTHSNLDITTGGPSATSNVADPLPPPASIMDDTSGHTHTIAVSFGNADNLPPYRNVVIAKKQAVPLGVSAPPSFTMPTGNPGTTTEYDFSTSEYVTVTDGGAGWTLSVVSTAWTKGADSIPAANVKLKTNGTLSTFPTKITGATTNVSETAEGTYSLDVSRNIATRSSGTEGDETDHQPTIAIVISPSQATGNYTGTLTFTVI